MESQRSSLESRYRELDGDELSHLHASGILTDIAYEVLEIEMRRRGMSVSSRPELRENASMPDGFVRRHWIGTGELWSAFWLFGVLGTGIAIAAAFIIADVTTGFWPRRPELPNSYLPFFSVIFAVIICYLSFASICIWRCSRNASRILWKAAARSIVVIFDSLFVCLFLAPSIASIA